jgi:hypothetical protein
MTDLAPAGSGVAARNTNAAAGDEAGRANPTSRIRDLSAR